MRARPCHRCLTPLYVGAIIGSDERLEVDARAVYLPPDEVDGTVVALSLIPYRFEFSGSVSYRARVDGTVGPYHRIHVCQGLTR